jgi:hypothetical protein
MLREAKWLCSYSTISYARSTPLYVVINKASELAVEILNICEFKVTSIAMG